MTKICNEQLKKRVGIIGSTGSIGLQAVDVIIRNQELFDVVFLTAHSNAKALSKIASKLNAKHAILTGEGMGNLLSLINSVEINVVLIGAAGTSVLLPAYELAKRGVTLAIANKECLVAAGPFIMDAAKKTGAHIIPVDSEHSAIFQSLCGHNSEDVEKIILTASGGAFRDYSLDQMKNITLEKALKHPNWSMGKKITIDSATMMNKGLELIEANVLFSMPPDKLDIVIHPQSIVHSMVSYRDGSVIAQMGEPDMRTPISYALNYPNRIISGVKSLDFSKDMNLTFFPPDLKKYPCLEIAIGVLNSNSLAQRIFMNAANEVAVQSFIEGRLTYDGIDRLIANSLDRVILDEPRSISDVIDVDKRARIIAEEIARSF